MIRQPRTPTTACACGTCRVCRDPHTAWSQALRDVDTEPQWTGRLTRRLGRRTVHIPAWLAAVQPLPTPQRAPRPAPSLTEFDSDMAAAIHRIRAGRTTTKDH